MDRRARPSPSSAPRRCRRGGSASTPASRRPRHGPPSPRGSARPIMTARAPRASALTTSPPRRIAAVEQDLDLVADGVDDRRQAPGSGAGVPSRLLPPWLDTEIGGGADVDRAAGVVRAHDPLDGEGAAPLLAEPPDVVPASAAVYRIHCPYAPKNVGGLLAGARPGCGTVRSGSVAAARASRAGSGAGRSPLARSGDHRLEVELLRDGAGCPSSRPRRERPVQGDDERLGAGVPGAVCPLRGCRSLAADPVGLEERLRVGGRDMPSTGRLAKELRPDRGARGGGGARDGDLARRGRRPARIPGGRRRSPGNEMSWPRTVVA